MPLMWPVVQVTCLISCGCCQIHSYALWSFTSENSLPHKYCQVFPYAFLTFFSVHLCLMTIVKFILMPLVPYECLSCVLWPLHAPFLWVPNDQCQPFASQSNLTVPVLCHRTPFIPNPFNNINNKNHHFLIFLPLGLVGLGQWSAWACSPWPD